MSTLIRSPHNLSPSRCRHALRNAGTWLLPNQPRQSASRAVMILYIDMTHIGTEVCGYHMPGFMSFTVGRAHGVWRVSRKGSGCGTPEHRMLWLRRDG